MSESIAVSLPLGRRSHGWIRTELLPALMFWVASYIALAVLGIWLWEGRGVISSELLFWEANRVLAVGVQPPNATVILLTYPPLILFLTLVAGSTVNAAALLGATVMTILSRLWHRSGAPWPWLALILLHPALLISAVEYPSLLVRVALLLLMLYCDLSYLTGDSPQSLIGGAFALGALALVDARLWPLWLYLTVVLVIARRRSLLEHLSLLLVAFLPVVFLTVSWAYLTWTQTGLAHYHLQSLPLATGAGAWSTDDLWTALTPRGLAESIAAQFLTLVRVAPAYLLLLAVVAITAWRPRAAAGQPSLGSPRSRLALVLLLAAPLVDLCCNALGSRANLSMLSMVLPVIALPLVWRARPPAPWLRWSAGVLLVVGLVWGWVLVFQPGPIEPQDLVRQALAQEAPPPYRDVAEIINHRLLPGQRVLLDENRMLPLVALIHDSQALMLSNNPDYAMAQLLPADWVDYVVASEGDSVLQDDSGRLSADYDLLLQQNGLRLYARRQP